MASVPEPELVRFAHVIGHEIRNPLSSVKIALQTLGRRTALDASDSRRVAIALDEIASLESTLGRVGEWVRPTPPRPGPVTVRALTGVALALAASRPGARPVECAPSDALDLALLADLDRGAAALVELLDNASSATPTDRSVRLIVEGTPHSVRFVVEDFGPGFTAEARSRAFEPFHTTRARGLGLGLALSRRCARAQGGDVVLGAGPGSTVVLELPRHEGTG